MSRYTTETMQVEGVECISIKDEEAGLRVSCIPRRGFILSGIRIRHPRHGDVEILYHEKAVPEKMLDGMCPLLFPIVGRLRLDGKPGIYVWQGRKYEMDLHGFAHKLPWEVVEISSDERGAWVTACLEDTAETRENYDFRFRFEMTYRVSEGSVEVIPFIRSDGPFSFGIHPFFNVPLTGTPGAKDRCTITVPSRTHWELEELVPTGRKLPVPKEFDLHEGMSLALLDIDAGFTDLEPDSVGRARCECLDAGSDMSVLLDADAKTFSEVIVYSPKDAPYVCIENWTGPPNAINSGLALMTPGTYLRSVIRITPRVVPGKERPT